MCMSLSGLAYRYFVKPVLHVLLLSWGHICEIWRCFPSVSISSWVHICSLQDLIENVVAVAENTADELARSDGRDVQLEEDPDLQLPFLLPEDGYSCDVVRNIPNGLQEFLDPLCQRGKHLSHLSWISIWVQVGIAGSLNNRPVELYQVSWGNCVPMTQEEFHWDERSCMFRHDPMWVHCLPWLSARSLPTWCHNKASLTTPLSWHGKQPRTPGFWGIQPIAS